MKVKRHVIALALAIGFVVLIVVAGTIMILRNKGLSVPSHSSKTYEGPSISFSYPATWHIGDCHSDEPFISIPGTISGIYKDNASYPLAIEGTTTGKCTDNVQDVAWTPEDTSRLNQKCEAQNIGERLANGLYLDTQEHADFEGTAWLIHIRQNACYVDTDQTVVTFSFVDPNGSITTQDILSYGEPRVDIQKLKTSQQYSEIKRFAESIKAR